MGKKDKEIKNLNAAIFNLKELVDIIGRKRKDGSFIDGIDAMSSNGRIDSHSSNRHQYSDEAAKKLTSRTMASSNREAYTFEGIVSDMLGHVLLNKEFQIE